MHEARAVLGRASKRAPRSGLVPAEQLSEPIVELVSRPARVGSTALPADQRGRLLVCNVIDERLGGKLSRNDVENPCLFGVSTETGIAMCRGSASARISASRCLNSDVLSYCVQRLHSARQCGPFPSSTSAIRWLNLLFARWAMSTRSGPHPPSGSSCKVRSARIASDKGPSCKE